LPPTTTIPNGVDGGGHRLAYNLRRALNILGVEAAEVAERVGASPATLFRYLPAARTAHGASAVH
jgi:hypothetical protein